MRLKPAKRHALVIAPEGVALRGVVGGLEAYCPLSPGALGPADSAPHAHFVLSDREALLEAIREVVRQVGGVKQAHLALDGPIMRVLSLPLTYLPERDALKLAVQTEAERYRVFAGADLALDFGIVKQDPESLALLFAAIRRDFVEEILAVCAAAGIEIVSVEPLSLALMRGLAEDAPRFLAAGAPQGVLCAVGQRLDLAVWQEGMLTHWRSIYLDVSSLRRGEGAALDEALVELQRSLHDMPARDWLLVGAPDSLEGALRDRPDLRVETRAMRADGVSAEALDGAARYAPEAFPFALDLGPEHVVAKRTFDNRQWGGILVAAALLGVGLGISIHIDRQVSDQRRAIALIQDETVQLQLELSRHSSTADGDAQLAGAFRASVESAELFGRLRELIPADAWLVETRMEPDKPLTLVGYALSRTAPVSFAEALGRLPLLSEVTVPEISQEEREGTTVYRFTITAARRAAQEATNGD